MEMAHNLIDRNKDTFFKLTLPIIGTLIIVDFDNNNAKIDVFVNVKFGCSVKDVAFRVQENIKSSVESMTEYKVESVNVHVVGVNFSEVESDFVS